MHVVQVILLATFGGSLAQVMTNQSCVSQPCTLGTSFVDIALVIDTSTSIDRPYFQTIQSFIKLWASDYSIGPGSNQVQFGFVTYGLWAASYGTFSTASDTIETLNSVVDDLVYQPVDERNMFNALTKVSNTLTASNTNSGWRDNATHLLVVFSGDSFTGPSTWNVVATNLRSQFDRVVAVGLTQKAITNQYQELVEFVGDNPANVLLIGDPSGLNSVHPWLEFHACNVSRSSALESTTTSGTSAPTSSPNATSCKLHQNIAIVYDMSEASSNPSLLNATYVYLKATFVSGWTIDANHANVAPVPFPNTEDYDNAGGIGNFQLGQAKSSVINLFNLQYQLLFYAGQGQSFTASNVSDIQSGLNYVQTSLITDPNNRPNVINTVIVLATTTSGVTNAAATASSLKGNGIAILTIALGSADANTLGSLASSQTYIFSLQDPSNSATSIATANAVYSALLNIPNGSLCEPTR